ncbi:MULTISPECIES: hypothetical protein [unclassified Sulfitobacter]|uniref:hypothetical protein n=1 Tax=unclassified Sulfitobacter TaxID=196795 RepID=UPI0037451FDF
MIRHTGEPAPTTNDGTEIKRGSRAAIAVFCFNRPASIRRLAQNLQSCEGLSHRPIYVYIDGPRNASEAVLVNQVFTEVSRLPSNQVRISKRTENLGLKRSLRLGISEVLEEHDSVIVLEDDLTLGRNALSYFDRAIALYRDDARVLSICGYKIGPKNGKSEASFLPMTHPWGWATWANRWRDHMQEFEAEAKPSLSSSFSVSMNAEGLRNYNQMLRLAYKKQVDSWWIYWQRYSVLTARVSLFPPESLVVNHGLHREGGQHSSKFNPVTRILPAKAFSDLLPDFPAAVEVDYETLDGCIRSREARTMRLVGFLGWLKRMVRRARI